MIRPRGLSHTFYWTGTRLWWCVLHHFNDVRVTARWLTLRQMGYSPAEIAAKDIGL